MNLTFCQTLDAKTVSAFESPGFLHVLVRCGRDLAHWGRFFETPFFRYVSVRYGRLKDIIYLVNILVVITVFTNTAKMSCFTEGH